MQSDLSHWKNQSSFELLSLDNILKNWHYPKNEKCHVWSKLLDLAIQFLHDCYLQWKRYSKSFILISCTFATFPALEIKKLVVVDKILWRFGIILHIWLINHFFIYFMQWLAFYTKWLKFCTRKFRIQYVCIDSKTIHQRIIFH